MSAASNDNTNDNPDNIIFAIKVKIICSCCNFIGRKQSKSIKNTANEFRYFSESHFVGVNSLLVLVYPNRNGDT